MSEHQVLWQNQFLAVKEHPEGYTYAHNIRTAGRLVAVVAYRKQGARWQFLARVEICPAHSDQPNTYSLTGGVVGDAGFRPTALRELHEEAGFVAEDTDLIDLGKVRPSKAEDTTVQLFAVDVTGKKQEEAPGDGSYWEEKESGTRWLSYEEGLQVIDPLFVTALARLKGQLEDGN